MKFQVHNCLNKTCTVIIAMEIKIWMGKSHKAPPLEAINSC